MFLTVKKRGVEALWQDFFSNTSQWWDHRPEKMSRRFPDFKHKQTGESLWVVDTRNPLWVQQELAALPPHTLQSNVFAWAQRLRRYVKEGQYMKTIAVFDQMQEERISPDTWTFLAVLNACARSGALEEGKRIHTQIMQVGCESNIYVASALVDMYAKCGSIEYAWAVFNKMPEPNVVMWSAIIGGYAKSGQGLKAMELFQKMQQQGVEADNVTFVGVLNACASVAALEEGKHVHGQIIQRGCEGDVYVGNCLVDMYTKCGSIEDAWRAFNKVQKRNVVTWSVMIGAYVKSGQGLKALELFRKMQQEGVQPDAITFVGVLNACASVVALDEGKRVHEQIVRRGLESNVYVESSLVDMYAKCGSVGDAWSVFKKIRRHDVITWSAMIVGYTKSGQGHKALELFWKMEHEGVEPDMVTFVGLLNACASLAILEEGRHVHKKIIRRGFESDVYIGNCLVDMYAKCGSIEDALGVFKKMSTRDVVAWNAMIRGYAMHGLAQEAIGLFKEMCKEGVEIDGITFMSLLLACSHAGLVMEGLRYFKSMRSTYNMQPTADHYACMVDLLGRAGRLQDAEELTKGMPLQKDVCVWIALLGACSTHGNIEIAERAAKQCWELDPGNASAHVLLSNVYAAARKCDRSSATEEERVERKLCEEPSHTCIE